MLTVISIIPAVKKHASYSALVGWAMVFITELLKIEVKEELPRTIALKAFPDILPKLIEHFSLQPAQLNDYKRQKTGFAIYRGVDHSMADREKVGKDSQNMADILCKCVALGLNTEVEKIVSKVLAEFHNASAEHFDIVVIGFLKRVLTALLSQKADLTDPRLRLLFQHGLAIYIDRFVKPEPERPTNWTRTARGCGCFHCIQLDEFLRSPNTQEFRCNSGVSPRKHLEMMLCRDAEDYNFETDKRHSPHTLIITKTTRNVQYTIDHAAWDRRGKTAVAGMKDLGVEPLKKLLGDQFDATMGLKWVRLGAHTSGSRPLNHMAQMAADDIEVITIE